MVIVVFRTHVKPQVDLAHLNALNQRMVALVSQMPGFFSLKDFSAQDGELLVIAEFDWFPGRAGGYPTGPPTDPYVSN